mmetsp:Transcript_53501/g.116639  ORF Transcript_53501/g.116639 Transcript_53501/m.116639 type:complete len:209 (-) Transcript_53501:587-1213(-)
MSLMSSPRAATSVATRIGARPDLKSASTRSRSRCSLSPWIALQPICLESARCSWSHVRLVEQKMSTREAPGRVLICCTKWWSLSCGDEIMMIRCSTSLLAVSFSLAVPMVTWHGSRWNSEASLLTSRGHVAVYMSDWYPGGTRAMIFRICGSNPMSSMRSASSSVKIITVSRETRARSIRSTSLPGVATRSSHPRSRSRSWSRMSAPP